ncbi:MAG TPA: M4 family metallopeptidase [Myxococcales bacterium]|nr:M4 family metallopeptidase [Myxococcales bacterium]
MHRSIRTALLLAALSSLGAQAASRAGPGADRIPEARAFLLGQPFGLGSQDDFKALNSIVNAQGETVVRFVQTHQGTAVNGTMAVVRLGRTIEVTAKHLEPGIRLPSAQPRLGPDQALAIAHRDLTPTAPYASAPAVEQVVFPSRLIGGVVPRLDAATGQARPDPLLSVAVGRAAAPHVWGYHVTRKLNGPDGRMVTLHVVVDGDSGVILRKWSGGQGDDPIASGAVLPPATDYLARAERVAMPIRVERNSSLAAPTTPPAPAWIPAVGLARTQFLGDVVIPSAYDPVNNGYGLLDLQRGTGGSFYTETAGFPAGNRILSQEIFNVVTTPDGRTVPWYRSFTMDVGLSAAGEIPGSLDNVWGNGLDYQKRNFSQSPFTDEGKTAAGEAMHAVTTTYDLLDKLFGRKSYDGLDTSILVMTNVKYMAGLAMWNPDTEWIEVGWGDPAAWGWVNGVIPTHSGSELTNIAHELGVAMYQATVAFTPNFSHERFQLERSNGALLAQLAEAYAQRQPGDPADVLPNAPVDWKFGRTRMDNRPFFWMDKPSRDGLSPDAWFDGIWMVGQQYFDTFNPGSGPMNRAWFFLAQGASADPSSDAYSPFLPQGMSGIGLAKTGAIAYKALTDYYTDETGYDLAREGCIKAAQALYGAQSAEAAAVANAFAAINVGGAAGQPAAVRVSFPPGQLDAGTVLSGVDILEHYMIVPVGQWVPLNAKVENATSAGIEWKAQGVPGLRTSNGGSAPTQGTFDGDLYRAPDKGDGFWSVQAFSKQDPRRFAQGIVWALATDGNGDGDFDALDFADYAMLCYLPFNFKDFLNPYALYGPHTSIADPDIQVVVEAFNNAYGR